MPGQRLTALTLSHFRSYVRARLAPAAGPAALIGPNGAGKTNLLEAISLLSPGRGLRRAAIGAFARRPEEMGWKIGAAIEAAGETHEVETWAERDASRQVRIDGKAAPQSALGRIVRVLWLVPSMDRLWIEGAEGRRRFLDRTTMSFLPEHADAVLAYERAMRERNRLLRDGPDDGRWSAALERRMAEAGAALSANRRTALTRLAAAQAEGRSAFPKAELALDDDAPETAEALAAALAASRARDAAAGRALVGPHRADLAAFYGARDVPARDCSTGEQKALLVSLILANARALAEEIGAAPILLLDEVAAHLDANRRATLYDEIMALGAQVWMTGTERTLFEPLGDRAQVLEVTEENGVSRILGD
ncbi:DNA replication/repair protein RecF [Roseitranquillus sediminis]|uniref:DNA replication/repair protein RecF n=1 Tax=Roseitranquillus sediminis TaxID=2809051 RepID=UPI001D0C3068|nr:DNA replication/repair protein RecF [Roseitranquillus sediminis]MBM9596146.1 DNA replication/repair protein RecF [Roseitranquillus sediminis]